MNEAEARSLADYAVSRGTMTRAQADTAMAADFPAAPPTAPASSAPNAAPASEPQPAPAAGQAFAGASPATESRRELADRMVAAGEISREAADRLLASDEPAASASTEPPQAPQKPGDPLGAIEIDPAFDRPASPDDYRFPLAGMTDITPSQYQGMQTLAHQMRLPQDIAHELFSIVKTYPEEMPTAELALLTRRTMGALQKRYGEQTQAKVAFARRLVDEVSRVNPALRQLIGTGVGSDLRFVMHMIDHAERLFGER